MLRRCKTTFILFVFIFLVSSSARAEESSQVVPSGLLDHAISAYQSNQIHEALTDFSRVLLFSPSDATAVSYLKKIIKHDDLTSEEKINLIVWEDLLNVSEDLQQKISRIFMENEKFKNRAIALGVTEEEIDVKLQESNSLSPQGSLEMITSEEHSAKFDGENVLSVLNKTFIVEKENLSNRWAALQDQQKKIISLLNEHSSVPAISFHPEKNVHHENIFTSEAAINDLEGFKKEFVLVREDVKGLKSYVSDQGQKINDLTRQLVESALQLSEKEMTLQERESYINSLKQKMDELHGRVDVSQKMMAQKDEEILEMENETKKIKSLLAQKEEYDAGPISAKDEQLSQLSGFLEIYKGKLYDTRKVLTQKAQNESLLKEQLQLAQSQLSERERALKNTQEDLNMLEKQLSDVQRQLLDVQKNSLDHSSREENYSDKISALQADVEKSLAIIQENLKELEKINSSLAVHFFQE